MIETIGWYIGFVVGLVGTLLVILCCLALVKYIANMGEKR